VFAAHNGNPHDVSVLAKVLVALVALEHCYILYVEMFRWTSAATQRSFGITREFAEASKALAANQGLYNGFLAAGLFWSLLAPSPIARPIAIFFLSCVVVAGIFGGLTAVRRILVVQALPAAIALLATIFI
jgi:putative membrane protein